MDNVHLQQRGGRGGGDFIIHKHIHHQAMHETGF